MSHSHYSIKETYRLNHINLHILQTYILFYNTEMPGININNSKHSLYNLFKNTKSITTYYI